MTLYNLDVRKCRTGFKLGHPQKGSREESIVLTFSFFFFFWGLVLRIYTAFHLFVQMFCVQGVFGYKEVQRILIS